MSLKHVAIELEERLSSAEHYWVSIADLSVSERFALDWFDFETRRSECWPMDWKTIDSHSTDCSPLVSIRQATTIATLEFEVDHCVSIAMQQAATYLTLGYESLTQVHCCYQSTQWLSH